MNTNYEIIDSTTFVVFTDKGEEITYKNSDYADSHDIFSYVFTENEIEHRLQNVVNLSAEKRKKTIRLSQLKKDIRALKRLKREIKYNKEYALFLNNRLQRMKNDINISEVSRKVKKLDK